MDIYGARLNTEGSVLDPTGILIAIADSQVTYPQVVFDSAFYVVVWQRRPYRYDSDIYGARVNPVVQELIPFPSRLSPACKIRLL